MLEERESQTGGSIALLGGTVIDGNGGLPLRDTAILIESGRIKSVSPNGDIEKRAAAEVIDVRGKFILPGLIDIHVHYADWMGELFLAHGVTTIKDMGNDIEWMSKVSEDARRGLMRGPRLFYVGNGLDAPPPVREHHVGLNSPQEARRAVEALQQMGASAIKVREKITPELLRAITDKAHDLDMPVTGHIKQMDACQAAEAGIDGLEHATGIVEALAGGPVNIPPGLNEVESFIEELKSFRLIEPEKAKEIVEYLASKKVALIPTMSNFWRMGSDRLDQFADEDAKYAGEQALAYVPDDVRGLWATSFVYKLKEADDRSKMRDAYKRVQELVVAHHDAGGKVLAGSDTFFSVPGLTLQRELLFLVDTGFTPAQAITMATRENAEFLGQGDDLGTIAPGKLADLIVVGADPLEDITNIQKLSLVIKAGRLMETGYHADYKIPHPRPRLTRPLWLERQLQAF